MTENQNDPVIQRLDRLERENWYWKRATILLLIVIGCISLMAVSSPRVANPLIQAQTIEAQKLVIKDDNGKVRAELSYKGPVVSLELHGTNTSTKAELSLWDGHISFDLCATNQFIPAQPYQVGVPPIQVFITACNPPAAKFTIMLDEESPVLGLTGKHGTVAAVLAQYASGNDSAALEVQDGKGARAVLGAEMLEMFNKDGKVLWKTPYAAELKCHQVNHTKEVYAEINYFIQHQSKDIQNWLKAKQKENKDMPDWFQHVVVGNCFEHPELSLSQSAEHVLNRWLNMQRQLGQ